MTHTSAPIFSSPHCQLLPFYLPPSFFLQDMYENVESMPARPLGLRKTNSIIQEEAPQLQAAGPHRASVPVIWIHFKVQPQCGHRNPEVVQEDGERKHQTLVRLNELYHMIMFRIDQHKFPFTFTLSYLFIYFPFKVDKLNRLRRALSHLLFHTEVQLYSGQHKTIREDMMLQGLVQTCKKMILVLR